MVPPQASAQGNVDYSDYSLRPILCDAAIAHRERIVSYEADGTVVFRHPDLARRGHPGELRIPASRQFPAIRATFDDLNKALSRLSNSPLLEGGRTLRDRYEDEAARYEEAAAAAHADGRWEPDYGTYVLDHVEGRLYLLAPEEWHRLALVTSNSALLTDPEGKLSWREVRDRLENAVIGFAGCSVGGGVLEGWVREARPRIVKAADLDWVELTNLNRGERMSIRHIVASRAQRFDPRNPYEVPRVSKAEYIAYEEHLVDPYAKFFVYKEGITRENLDRFLLGNGSDEPRLDVFVEEMDHLELKVLVRERCRELKIDVLMLSDFGHRSHVLWHPYGSRGDVGLGYGVDDRTLHATLEEARRGGREKTFGFMAAMAGQDFAGDQFKAWMEGRGEQPTSSMPQSGATAMASGAVGGKELALHVLGYHQEGPLRVVYDLLRRDSQAG